MPGDYTPYDPQKQFGNGFDYVNKIYDQAALLDAGRKYATGDYSGAAQAVGSRGDFTTADKLRTTGTDIAAGQQYAAGDLAGAQQTKAQGGDVAGAQSIAAKQAEIFQKQHAYLGQAVPILTQIYQKAGPQGLSQAFDQITPELQANGTTPDQIQRLKDGFASNPEQTLQVLSATAAKKFTFQKIGDNGLAVFDEANPQAGPVATFNGTPKAPEGYQYVQPEPANPAANEQAVPQAASKASLPPQGQSTYAAQIAGYAQPAGSGQITSISQAANGAPRLGGDSTQASRPNVAPPNGRSLSYIPGGPADPAVIERNAKTRREIIINNPAPQRGGGTDNVADPVVQSWVSNVLNGNATMQQVPAGYRNAVSRALADAPQQGYSPVAASRFSTAANRILQNFIKLPQYELTANGLPYLERIDAAIKNPGSVSDQDLLDSLTKLNTSGNAISDAQVRLITDGRSYSDMVNVFENKFRNGGVLSNTQRQQIVAIAKQIYDNYRKGYQPVYDQATRQLKASGIPQAFWSLPDLNNLGEQALGNIGGAGSPAGRTSGRFRIEQVSP